MQIGREPWKWGLVFLLLAVFIIVANQAYVALNTKEDFLPPTDWEKGDSFDLEHGQGPGAGIPITLPDGEPDPKEQPEAAPTVPDQPQLDHQPIDWSETPDDKPD